MALDYDLFGTVLGQSNIFGLMWVLPVILAIIAMLLISRDPDDWPILSILLIIGLNILGLSLSPAIIMVLLIVWITTEIFQNKGLLQKLRAWTLKRPEVGSVEARVNRASVSNTMFLKSLPGKAKPLLGTALNRMKGIKMPDLSDKKPDFRSGWTVNVTDKDPLGKQRMKIKTYSPDRTQAMKNMDFFPHMPDGINFNTWQPEHNESLASGVSYKMGLKNKRFRRKRR